MSNLGYVTVYNMYRRARRVRFPCTVCSTESGNDAIQCHACGDWTHATCVNMSEDDLRTFEPLNFYCPTYVRRSMDNSVGNFAYGGKYIIMCITQAFSVHKQELIRR